MKKAVILGLLIILLGLSACGGSGRKDSSTPAESKQPTVENDFAGREAELQSEIAALKAQLADVETLKEERDAAVAKADKYYSMFVVENADSEGDYIFCEHAFDTSFGYADKVSMRMELIKYLARLRGYNPESMSSEHQTLYSTADDIIVKVRGGGYMFMFLVRYGEGGLGYHDAVFDLINGCYVDFPYLEAKFLSVGK